MINGELNMDCNGISPVLLQLSNNDAQACQSCVVGRAPRSTIPKQCSMEQASGLYDLVHKDLCAPIEVLSVGGAIRL